MALLNGTESPLPHPGEELEVEVQAGPVLHDWPSINT